MNIQILKHGMLATLGAIAFLCLSETSMVCFASPSLFQKTFERHVQGVPTQDARIFHFAALDPSETIKEMAREKQLQTDLPFDPSFLEKTPNPADVQNVQRSWDMSLLSFNGFFKVLFFIALFVIVAIIVWLLPHNLWGLDQSSNLDSDDETIVGKNSTKNRMNEARLEADELACEGQYTEAMRVLLQRSLKEIKLRLETNFSSSLTSREIYKQVKISQKARSAFADIISRVEFSYFGEYPAEQKDFEECKSSFDVLSQALRSER